MSAFGRAAPPAHTIAAAAGGVVKARSEAEEQHGSPVARADLELAVASALMKVRRTWPKRLMPGDHRHLRPWARSVFDHLETSRLHVFQALSVSAAT